jgi:F0F1-type ATP synthase delta subunit
MQNDQIYSDITNLVSTREDLNLINSELDLLEAAIYETKENTFEFVLNNSISASISSLISTLLLEKEEREVVIKKIKDNLKEIKFVELTIAVNPTEKLRTEMINLIKKSTNQRIALDIKVDPSIIGGVKIMFNGRYYDVSLKSKLDKILNYAEI